MLASLRARLIVSFAVVVALAVFLAGAGALILLRDRENEDARERYGRHAEPLNESLATLLALNVPLADIKASMEERAADLGIRIVMLDDNLLVVFDSDAELQGRYILSLEDPDLRTVDDGSASYKWANYDGGGDDLTLFAPPLEPRPEGGFASPEYTAIIAIPRSELSSAWLALAPRLALAGAIALAASFAVAYLISRSISGPLARITAASVQMAKGNYDVHIPISGQDEVGRLSEAFNFMAREISSSQQMMQDLLANVSHELKTPLTSIQGFSQAMLDGAIKDEEEFKESCRIINEEANRMRALVDDLLLLSQLESGQVEMQHVHVDLVEVMRRTIERFQWALREAGVEAKLRVGRPATVHGDERRLEQMFSNLMQNAVRHTPAGGTITLSVAVAKDGSIGASVHNTGSYIPPEDVNRVFERFFQVDRMRARKGGSSGLGLSIVSEIAEAHGGSVRAVSDLAKGTEFIVTLPSAETADLRAGRGATAEGTPKRAAKKREAPA